MTLMVFSLVVMSLSLVVQGASAQQVSPGAQQPGIPATSDTVQAGEPKAPPQSVPGEPAIDAGSMDPAQVKTLAQKIWLAEYRVNDLLAQLHPERWKISDATRKSFDGTLTTLRDQLNILEVWRSQFENRPDSMYLGYETYAAISSLLPRLDGVARTAGEHENASFAAQYGEAGSQLFDSQQAIRPYIGFLLRNQDELLQALENNVASCQNSLGYAMRSSAKPAKPMKNEHFVRPEPRSSQRDVVSSGSGGRKSVKQKPGSN
jgi:hypothetical protein